MNKIILALACSWFSGLSFAAYIVDIYGAEKKHADQMLQKYSNQVKEIESALDQEDKILKLSEKTTSPKIEKIQERKKILEERIKKDGMFLYVHFHSTFYPTERDQYITIEVVEKTQPERLTFLTPVSEIKKYSHHADLIEKMREFDALGMRLAISHQLNATNIRCPVYHCVFGFDHPKLKPYLNIFNTGAIKEKEKILNTLNNDPDPERRAAAAFLVGHFKNPKEIISTLSKHINDKDQTVRNNVIRVIGLTMIQGHIDHINIAPFLKLLKSPYGTDRNKALAVLVSASSDAATRSLIINEGRDDLLALLQLKQLNNHEWVYLLLKKISGKNYGEYDIAAWDKWFSTVKKG